MFEVCMPCLDARLRKRNSLAISPSDDLELFRSGCSVAESSSWHDNPSERGLGVEKSMPASTPRSIRLLGRGLHLLSNTQNDL
jgi:hypothetical protein